MSPERHAFADKILASPSRPARLTFRAASREERTCPASRRPPASNVPHIDNVDG